MTVEVSVEDDGTGTITVTAAADAELLARDPGVVEELRLDDVRAAGWTVDGPAPMETGGASVRLTKPFRTPEEATAILAELNGPSGPLHEMVLAQTREFARVTTTFTGTARLDGGIAAFADQALIDLTGSPPFAAETGADPGGSIGLTIRLRAPGSVVETTGTVEAGSVTWEPSLAAGATTDISALTEQRDRVAERAKSWQRFASAAIWVWLGIVAALVVAAAALILRSRRAR